MSKLIDFLNSFMSYGLKFVVCVAVAAIGIVIGILWTKHNNAKDTADTEAVKNTETEEV